MLIINNISDIIKFVGDNDTKVIIIIPCEFVVDSVGHELDCYKIYNGGQFMDVIRKAFTGGYKFGILEGQPSQSITKFTPKNEVINPVTLPDKSKTAADVLNALGLTAFSGPANAKVATEGYIEPSKVKNILVTMVETEPYNLSNVLLLKSNQKLVFFDGLKQIHESYKQAKITLVIGENQTDLIQIIAGETIDSSWLEVVTITAKYPANLKELAIPTVLGKKYPVGYSPAQIGVLYLTTSQVIVVGESLKLNKLSDSILVALAGTGWKENITIQVPVGTPIESIKKAYLADGEVRVLKNSILTSNNIKDDAVVDYDVSVLVALPEDRKRQSLFFLRAGKDADSYSRSFISSLMPKAKLKSTTSLNGERRPCVSCTYCQEVCPVGLYPQLLHKHVDKKLINKRLAEYKIFDCIECGLCDYVCPSKIEVSSDIKKGKILLEESDISHNKYIIPFCDMVNAVKEVEGNE